MFLIRGIFIFLLVTGISNNKMKLTITPSVVISGTDLTLQCSYDLEGEQLYAVKWYKEETEFYKFTPRENPSKKRFNIPGLKVLLEQSNETHVTLTNTIYENSGLYGCEVTADAPSFYTKIERSTLKVIDAPTQGPQITGLKSKYRPGELLKAECVTKGSRPAANLTWLINGQPVDLARIRHNKLFQSHSGLSIQSGLRMHITQEMVSEGRFSVSCTATIYDIYNQSCERSVEFSRPRHKVGTTSKTRTTSAAPPSNNLYYALPAARHPETTLIFTMEDENGGASSSKDHYLLLYFICVVLLWFCII